MWTWQITFFMFNCIVGTNKFQINYLDAFSNNLFQHYLTSSLNLLNTFILPSMQLLSYIYNVLLTHSFSSNPRLWAISLSRKKLEIYIIFLDWKKKCSFLRKLSSTLQRWWYLCSWFLILSPHLLRLLGLGPGLCMTWSQHLLQTRHDFYKIREHFLFLALTPALTSPNLVRDIAINEQMELFSFVSRVNSTVYQHSE